MAVRHAREWAALNETRAAVLQKTNPQWEVAAMSDPVAIIGQILVMKVCLFFCINEIFCPMMSVALSEGSANDVIAWIEYAVAKHFYRIRNPAGGLAIPLVWRDHYSILLIPVRTQTPAQLFDPNRLGRRSYPSFDVSLVQQVLNRPVHPTEFTTRSKNKNALPATTKMGLQDDGIHDIFCAVWILWFMAYGIGEKGTPMPRPVFADIFRFLQQTVRAMQDDFYDYLIHDAEPRALSPTEATSAIRTLLSVTPDMYKNAFYHRSI